MFLSLFCRVKDFFKIIGYLRIATDIGIFNAFTDSSFILDILISQYNGFSVQVNRFFSFLWALYFTTYRFARAIDKDCGI
jgi:hypothetical protein